MTPAQISGHGLTDFPDTNLHCQFYNSTNQCWAANGSALNSQGITSTDLNLLQSNLTKISTSMNISPGSTGAFDQNYAAGGSVYYDSASGYLIQMYHGEFWYSGPGGPFYSGLGLAYSTDFGATWNKLGQVISPQTPRSGSCQVDVGGGSLVPVMVSGVPYFYTPYVDESPTCNGGNFNIAMARAKVSDVIAAAVAGTPFTSGAGTLFMKYTGGGGWTGDGVSDLANPQNGGGAFAALTTDNVSWVPSMAYNSAISQYVMVTANWTGIYMRLSSDAVTWGSPIQIVGGGSTPPNAIYYPALLSTIGSGSNPELLGPNFYVYYVDPFGNWANTNLKRISVSFAGPPPPTSPFISQSGGGSGTSCTDPLPVSYFNTPSSWGAGKISGGSTVHLCGIITSTLQFQGGGTGTGANRVTLLAESGAILSQPVGQLINCEGFSHILLNGGTNGIIRNTANGTNLTFQQMIRAVECDNAGDIEVENWSATGLYVHVAPGGPSDGNGSSCIDETFSNFFYDYPATGNVKVHDNSIANVGWAIRVDGPTVNGTDIQVYNNIIQSMNHGVEGGGDTTQYTYEVTSNQFGAMANWDTTLNCYHHDPIHFFTGSPNPSDTTTIANNKFFGDPGVNNTADIFLENGQPNVLQYNNVYIGDVVHALNNGFYNNQGGANHRVFNETFIGQGINNSGCIEERTGSSVTFKNNLLIGCNNYVSIYPGVTITGWDYNTYAAQASGGNSAWNNGAGTSTNTFSAWQSGSGLDAHGQSLSMSPVNSSGVPSMGSAVIAAALNLTSLGISGLDCDTTDGNLRTCTARPVGPTAWTTGAYTFSAPAPATGNSLLGLGMGQ